MSHISKWTQFYPFGISLSAPGSRPVLLLKDEDKTQTLAIWLTPIEATMAVAGLNMSNAGTEPHTLLHRMMMELNWKNAECYFTEIVGHHQHVELKFKSAQGMNSFRLRADENMSACLALNAKFFAHDEFIQKSKQTEGELTLLEQGLKAHPALLDKGHSFLM